jgi:hypothetical protein
LLALGAVAARPSTAGEALARPLTDVEHKVLRATVPDEYNWQTLNVMWTSREDGQTYRAILPTRAGTHLYEIRPWAGWKGSIDLHVAV